MDGRFIREVVFLADGLEVSNVDTLVSTTAVEDEDEEHSICNACASACALLLLVSDDCLFHLASAAFLLLFLVADCFARSTSSLS